MSEEDIDAYRDRDTTVSKPRRVRLQRIYIRYVAEMYANRFGNQHLTPDILSYLATNMTRQYPALRDPDSSPESPTFVSVYLAYFHSHCDWLTRDNVL